MCVTRMQDIGGCRVILENRDQLLRLNASLEQSRTVHVTKDVKDYNLYPKPTGYRGIHRIYQCYGKKETHDWKGFTIELQLRTKLQHLWATTVEVVDLCEGRSLKTNPFDADQQWIAFFREMSYFLAHEDGFVYLSNEEKNTKKHALLELDIAVNAIQKLQSFNLISSNKQVVEEHADHRYAIIGIRLEDQKTFFKFFKENQKEEAIGLYSTIEKDSLWNCLFVEMADIKQLRYAYPNYLIDTSSFIEKFNAFAKSSYWVAPQKKR